MSDTADAVSLSSSTPQRQLSSINNLLQKSVEQIRERISDGKKYQQWAFGELHEQVENKAEMTGIVVSKVEPAYTSQQCSQCGCTLDENRNGLLC